MEINTVSKRKSGKNAFLILKVLVEQGEYHYEPWSLSLVGQQEQAGHTDRR